MVSRLKVSRRYKDGMKYGVQVDRENNNTLWADATKKELDKVRVAFELLNKSEKVPAGYAKIPYHIIYNIKIDLAHKVRLVAGGHRHKNVPKHLTYSSVVSKDSIQICFTLLALNDLDVLSGDIGNAYLNAKPLEKCYVVIEDAFMFGPNAVGRNADC